MLTLKSRLDEVLSRLAEEQVRQVLEFASQLSSEEERLEWQEFGRNALNRAYGPEEPEYNYTNTSFS